MTERQTFQNLLRDLGEIREAVALSGCLDQPLAERYLTAVSTLCRVPCAALVTLHEGARGELLALHGRCPNGLETWLSDAGARRVFARVADLGFVVQDSPPDVADGWSLALVRVPPTPGDDDPVHVLVLAVEREQGFRINEMLVRAQLVSEAIVPASIAQAALHPATEPHGGSNETGTLVLGMLDLLRDVYRATIHRAACYALVNGIAARCQAVDQVVLGWRAGAYVRVLAISHYDRFEVRTETVQLFEAALEEAADQDRAVSGHGAAGLDPGLVEFAHRQLRTHLGAQELLTLPLHDDQGEVCAALMLISADAQIEASTLAAVHVVAQTAMAHLQGLHRRSGGLFLRLGRGIRQATGWLMGAENLIVKTVTLLLAAVLLVLISVSVDHRVNGVARLTTDETRLVAAPYAGVIGDVLATSGDLVEAGAPLVILETEERLLQLAELEADLQRASAELDRARAEFSAVDMAIAEARLAQVRARIAQTNLQIAQSVLRAPLSGVVVEGDRRDLLSASVTQGQSLLRVAALTEMSVLIEVAESDVRAIAPGRTGEFTLVARPGEPIPIRIETIVPMARVKGESGAVFELTAQLETEPRDWWRPGMTGVARIDDQPRRLIWVLTHRAWNQLRLWLWF